MDNAVSRSMMLGTTWEILLILLILLVMGALVLGVPILIFWLARRKTPPSTPKPLQAKPPLPASACPHCGTALPSEAPQGLCPRCVLGVGLARQTEATGELGPQDTAVRPPPPEPGEIAPHFPHLEILECLGRGGMGMVYKARQPNLNRLVALKILAPEKGADPKFAERFRREAQTLARLSHPNIVTVHDFGETGGYYYLLMEYVDGMTLRQLLQAQKLAPEEALSIVPKICEALQFAHEHGVVHRDIKPENVLLDKQGRVKIADFGIAKIVAAQPGQTLTQDQVVGTPHYMAPEQVEHPKEVDHRADIYSLGVVFYEMLTRELPLGRFQPPSKKVQVDVRLDEIVLHALEKEPERRYQHANEVKMDLETIATTPAGDGREETASPHQAQEQHTSGTSNLAAQPRLSDSAISLKKFGILVTAVLAVLLLLLGGAIGIYLRSKAARSQFPQTAHIGRSNQTVLVCHDKADLHYALYYPGEFSSSSRGSHNQQAKTWIDDGTLTLKNGGSFGFQRRSTDPQHLSLNGREFDLREGRVFTLHDDGTASQLPLFPALAAALDIEQLAALVRKGSLPETPAPNSSPTNASP